MQEGHQHQNAMRVYSAAEAVLMKFYTSDYIQHYVK